jgi:hypothetical protein
MSGSFHLLEKKVTRGIEELMNCDLSFLEIEIEDITQEN